MKKKIVAVLGMVMALSVGIMGCSSNGVETDGEGAVQQESKTIVVTDQKGEVEVPVNPKNVVVLDYGSLDIMSKLGVEPVALPKSALPSYLDKYKEDKYIDLGTLKEFDLEKINEAEPDLIIIERRQEAYYDDLKKIAPVLYLGTSNNDMFASVKSNSDILGKVFNNSQDIEIELENINNRLDEINKKVKESNMTALMTMFNEGSLSVYGEGSRYDMVYSKFGFIPVDNQIEASDHGQNISFEYLKEKNPDYLFVLDRGAVVGSQESVKEAVENELVKTTKAYKEDKIIYVNPQAWYVGGSGFMAIDAILSDIENAVGIK